MRLTKNLIVALLGAFLSTALVAGPADAAPKKPNAAWTQECKTVLQVGPYKRFGHKRCVLVHTPPGQRPEMGMSGNALWKPGVRR